MKYNPKIVAAFFASYGLQFPVFEHVFAPPRKWRFDLAWTTAKVAVEVQGGIWTRGRHNRGAAMLREWEKLNTAASLGWRVLYVQPCDLCLKSTAELILKTLCASQ